MPIKSAAFKALRHSQKRRQLNLGVKHGLKKLNIKLRKALTAKQHDQAREIVRNYARALDKAYQHGVITRNTAARKKSRIHAAVRRAIS